MRLSVLLFAFFCALQPACASPWKTGGIYTGADNIEVSRSEVAGRVKPGSVVVVGEIHDDPAHHENQVILLQSLAERGLSKISVGMEFFARTVQGAVDRFLAGLLPEADFLKQAEWAGGKFDLYRRQVLFPKSHGGTTVALNAPRSLTSRVSKVGLAGLTPEEKAQIPQGFTLGNAGYFERFRKTMEGHVPADAISRYFEAQSVWDETMASTAVEFMRANPDQVLVIIVGDFHAQYGGGLPDRLKARGASDVITVSQVSLKDLYPSEEDQAMHPDPKHGSRGDYIWVSR